MRDLTDATENARVLELATELLAEHGSRIGEVDRAASGPPLSVGDPVLLEALRCAAARHRLIEARSEVGDVPVALSVVWAMYGETARLRPATADNPHGEDLLRVKVDQIRWLVDGLNVTWHLVAVDDGCPDRPSSAEVARAIARSEGWSRAGTEPGTGEQVTVLELADVVGADGGNAGPSFRRLASTAESRKGGSILYGLWHALGRDRTDLPDQDEQRHVLAYTDADLSANLAQAGLLVGPILDRAANAVVGQRYGIDGAVLVTGRGPSTEPVSTGSKPDKMIILFRHFVRAALMPQLAHVIDTQAGFKAFDGPTLAGIIGDMESFDETFDVELLIRLTQIDPASGTGLAVAPIVFVEDFAASNFPSVDPQQRHLDMIDQLLALHDRLIADAQPGGDRSAPPLLAWLRGLDLTAYVETIERLRDEDEANAATGRPDPLFDSRWSLDELTSVRR